MQPAASVTNTEKGAILNLSTGKSSEVIRHTFTPDEVSAMNAELSSNLIKHNALDEELKEMKVVYKQKMDPLAKQNKTLLKNIKHGFVDQEVEVMLVPDYQNNIMEFYNDEGTKVGERRMMISERQLPLDLK